MDVVFVGPFGAGIQKGGYRWLRQGRDGQTGCAAFGGVGASVGAAADGPGGGAAVVCADAAGPVDAADAGVVLVHQGERHADQWAHGGCAAAGCGEAARARAGLDTGMPGLRPASAGRRMARSDMLTRSLTSIDEGDVVDARDISGGTFHDF
jgi:hypothetical protein